MKMALALTRFPAARPESGASATGRAAGDRCFPLFGKKCALAFTRAARRPSVGTPGTVGREREQNVARKQKTITGISPRRHVIARRHERLKIEERQREMGLIQ